MNLSLVDSIIWETEKQSNVVVSDELHWICTQLFIYFWFEFNHCYYLVFIFLLSASYISLIFVLFTFRRRICLHFNIVVRLLLNFRDNLHHGALEKHTSTKIKERVKEKRLSSTCMVEFCRVRDFFSLLIFRHQSFLTEINKNRRERAKQKHKKAGELLSVLFFDCCFVVLARIRSEEVKMCIKIIWGGSCHFLCVLLLYHNCHAITFAFPSNGSFDY